MSYERAFFFLRSLGRLREYRFRQGVKDYHSGRPPVDEPEEQRVGHRISAITNHARGYWDARDGRPYSGDTSEYHDGYITGQWAKRRLEQAQP